MKSVLDASVARNLKALTTTTEWARLARRSVVPVLHAALMADGNPRTVIVLPKRQVLVLEARTGRDSPIFLGWRDAAAGEYRVSGVITAESWIVGGVK